MFIKKYKYEGRAEEPWSFNQVEFSNLNLFVGDSATGKTRLLNTMFNLGTFVVRDSYVGGFWDIEFEHFDKRFRWQIEASTNDAVDGDSKRFIEEKLWSYDGNKYVLIVDRDQERFLFNDKELPKLSPELTSLSLLKQEGQINPAFEGFSTMLRRRFFMNALEGVTNLSTISPDFIKKIEKNKSLRDLFFEDPTLNAKLYILDKYFQTIFKEITDHYKAIFPFIQETRVLSLNEIAKHVGFASDIPVFCIRENGIDRWIPITEISSGMQKVLLVLTDILGLPEGGIYILDEYENSLGIGAINFLPEFLFDLEKNIQIFITSHHPYLINEIPPEKWFVFHRNGNTVSIKYGPELIERFGKSTQQAFIKLINDPFYTQGIE